MCARLGVPAAGPRVPFQSGPLQESKHSCVPCLRAACLVTGHEVVFLVVVFVPLRKGCTLRRIDSLAVFSRDSRHPWS